MAGLTVCDLEFKLRDEPMTPEDAVSLLPNVQGQISEQEELMEKDFGLDREPHLLVAPAFDATDPNPDKYAEEVYEQARKALNCQDLKFGAGQWYMIGGLGQRFGPQAVPKGELINQQESIDFLWRLGVNSVSFHTRTEASPKNIDSLAEMLSSRDMEFGSVFANVFSEPHFIRYGGVASPNDAARKLALLRKMEGFLWDVEYGCDFQTDWLGACGTFLYNNRTSRDEKLVEYNTAMLLYTGGAVRMAKEFKPGDPAEEMAETNAPTCILQAQDSEKRIHDVILADVLLEKGMNAPHNEVEEEVRKRFEIYDHAIGVNIEDAHVLLQPYQTVAGAAELCIAYNRLIHRHPNDTKGQVDNDLIFGTIHLNDAIKTCYVERKAGLHKEITYEPDIFPVTECALAMYAESINAVNYCHAVAARLIEMEQEMNIESVYETAPSIFSGIMRTAIQSPKDFIPIDVNKVVTAYRGEIGKPIKFKPNKDFYVDVPTTAG
jgi:hypothetical protein